MTYFEMFLLNAYFIFLGQNQKPCICSKGSQSTLLEGALIYGKYCFSLSIGQVDGVIPQSKTEIYQLRKLSIDYRINCKTGGIFDWFFKILLLLIISVRVCFLFNLDLVNFGIKDYFRSDLI